MQKLTFEAKIAKAAQSIATAREKVKDAVKSAAKYGSFETTVSLENLKLDLSLGQELASYFHKVEGFSTCIKTTTVSYDGPGGQYDEDVLYINWENKI